MKTILLPACTSDIDSPGFATQYSALPMYRHMHGWVFIFFSGCMLFAFLVIYFTYPETKGITLEEVEVVFGSGAGARVKQALGRRRASIEGVEAEDEDADNKAVTLNEIPKLARRHMSLAKQNDDEL